MVTAVPVLETERLSLRPFTLADAPTIQGLAGDGEVAATTLNIPHPYPEGDAASWIEIQATKAAQGESYTWAVVRRQDGVLMGQVTLGVTFRHRRGNLGYWLGAPFWNQGYTTEATRRVIKFGFEEVGLYRIQASCLPRNVASYRVMEKAGLRYEGRLRGYLLKGETFEDVIIYALLGPEVLGVGE